MKSRSVHLSIACLAVSLALSQIAHAAPSSAPTTDTVASLTAEAATAFDAGDFAAAADAFQRAYDLSPDPRVLYNLGRIHEEAGELALASSYYRKFIEQPGVELELRERASQRLEVLARISSTLEPEPPPPRLIEAPPPAVTPTDTGVDVQKRGRGMRNGGIGLLGGAVVLLVTGAITGALAQRTSADLDDEVDAWRRRDLVARGGGLALATDVTLSVGAAFAIVGSVLTTVGAVRMRKSSRSRISRAVRPAGIGLTYRF